jgi:hypothetical protein
MNRLIALAIAAIPVVGCVDAPITLREAMPRVPPPQILPATTAGTPMLDCISNQLRPFNDAMGIRVTVGQIPNKMPQQVSEMVLPSDIRDMIMQSLGRVTNVFQLYNTGDQTVPYELERLPPVPETVLRSIRENEVIKPHFQIVGDLSGAQIVKRGEAQAEAVIGAGAVVQAFDLVLHLRAVDAGSLRVLGPPVTLHARLFSGTHGVSAFVLFGSNYAKGEQQFQVNVPTTYGLQLAADYAVASLIENVASANLPVSFAACRGLAADSRATHEPDESITRLPKQSVAVDLRKARDSFCAKFSTQQWGDIGERIRITLTEYRSGGIPLSVRYQIVPSNIDETCIPSKHISQLTDTVEVTYETLDGRVLGGALVSSR